MKTENKNQKSEGKHTPGPWHIEEMDHAHVITDGKYVVADVFKPEPHTASVETSEDATANAELIVAAPELLVALKNARIALSFYSAEMTADNPGKSKIYPFGIAAEHEARAAIAKAEGRAGAGA